MLLCTQASSNWNWEPVIISPTESLLLTAELRLSPEQGPIVRNWLESSLSKWWLFEGVTDIKIFHDSDADEVCMIMSFENDVVGQVAGYAKTLEAEFKSKQTDGLLSSYHIKSRKCELIE